MISAEEMKKALSAGGTVLISKSRLIHSLDEIPVEPVSVVQPVSGNLSEMVEQLQSQVQQVKNNQSDVTKLSSVQKLLSSYDQKISDLVQVSNQAINQTNWIQTEW